MRTATSLSILFISLASMKTFAQTKINGVPVDLSQATFIPYAIDSAFAISVPDYLVKVDYLSMDARLQFSNELMKTYMIVSTEAKSAKPNNDLASLVKRFEKKVRIKGGKFIERDDQLISGYPSKMMKLTWTVDGEPLMYVACFVDTPNLLYKIYSWTPTSQSELESEFRKIALSFENQNNNYSY